MLPIRLCVIFSSSSISWLNFRGILYNVVLNVKQTNTEQELVKLRQIFEDHKTTLRNLSMDLSDISEKIKVVETDLEDVKAANNDISDLRQIQATLLSYAANFNQTESLQGEAKTLFLASSAGRIRLQTVLMIFAPTLTVKYFWWNLNNENCALANK